MVDQISLINAIAKELARQKYPFLNCRQMNTVLQAANLIVAEIGKPTKLSVPGEGLSSWLASDDTGMSSKYMAFVLADGPPASSAHPHDADDFGRCSRFLLAVTERKDIEAMKSCGRIWNALGTLWPALEIALKNKQYEAIYRMIQLVEDDAKK